jgi:hypothetical protein
MTDSELTAFVAAVKQVVAERDISARTEVESLRQDLAALQARFDAQRDANAESQRRMLGSLAGAVGDAVAPRLAALERRAVELEQRSMAATPEVAQ